MIEAGRNKKTSFQVPENELREKFIRAGGPGGQHVNKVATAVQLRWDLDASTILSAWQKRQLRRIASHLVTGDGELVIEVAKFRSQAQNREEARQRLAELLEKVSQPPPKKRRPTRPGRAAVERRLKAKARRSQVKSQRRTRLSGDE